MSRRLRIVIASALLVVALLGVLGVVTQIGITYYLPPAENGEATRHVAAFAPAVAGTVVAGLAALALVGNLVVVIRRALPRWAWIVAALLTVIAVAVPVIVAALQRPVF
jgi:hypothetical protein